MTIRLVLPIRAELRKVIPIFRRGWLFRRELAASVVNPATLPAMTGTTPLGGSGTAHTHSMDIRVQYVDCIIAYKT